MDINGVLAQLHGVMIVGIMKSTMQLSIMGMASASRSLGKEIGILYYNSTSFYQRLYSMEQYNKTFGKVELLLNEGYSNVFCTPPREVGGL